MLQLNTWKYQLVKDPYNPLRVSEIMELDNDDVYIRYKQKDKEEDWIIINQNKISKTFEDYVDKDLLDMIDIKDELPITGKEILGLTSAGDKIYVYRCGHAPDCTTWKQMGHSLMVDIIKWKYIN